MSKGSDLLVAALENEGVECIFGIPGEENLDVLESLRRSKIKLVLTRHEQAAGFMAATYGRLTGRAGVCLTTLGPGALNLTTSAAYAHLGAMPMVMITGQKAIRSSRQARFQIVDIVATMRPLTKMATQIVSAQSIPTLVRDAFRVAQQERPGPVHLELPEDIAADDASAEIIPPHAVDLPVAPPAAIERAAAMIMAAKRPLVMLGAAASRPHLAEPLSAFVRRAGIPFFNTQMGKGAVNAGSNLYIGTAALSERRLRARGDRPRRSHHGHRPRHRREAAVPHGPRGTAGDPCRGNAGEGGAGLFSASRDGWRCRPESRAARRPAGGQTAECVGLARSARRHSGAARRGRRGGPVSADAAAHRARRAKGDAAGRHRRARQRHVQDLVRPQLPHLRRQHAAARQRAGDDGCGAAVGDDGGAAASRAARARGLRRRRLHDEFAGDWKPRCG